MASGDEPDEGATSDEPELLAWAIAGNVLEIERSGKVPGEIYRGTPVFAPKAKLFAGEVYRGTIATAHFIGRNRTSGRLGNAAVSLHLVHNYRVTAIYSAKLHSKLAKLEASLFTDRAEAESHCDQLAFLSRERRNEMASYSGTEF